MVLPKITTREHVKPGEKLQLGTVTLFVEFTFFSMKLTRDFMAKKGGGPFVLRSGLKGGGGEQC